MQSNLILRGSLAAIIVTFAATCFAQTPTFFGSGNKGNTTTNNPQSSQGPMSANEFKNMVNSLNKTNQANLTQQVSQQISAALPSMTGGPSATGSTPGITNPSTSGAAQSPTTVTPNTSTSISSSSTQPAQTQTFTGFGTGTSTTPSTTPSNTPSRTKPATGGGGNWNINY